MRPARAIMADLAATGMTPDQIALVMELSAAVSAEARPVVDESAERRRDRDREYQAQKRAERRQISADSGDVDDAPALSRPPNENISNPPTHTHPDITTRAQGPWDFHVSAWQDWRQAHPFPRPWWADKQVWADWLKVRHRKKAQNTITAYTGFLRDVDKHSDAQWPPGRLLEHAVARSWLSINRPEEPKNGRFSTANNITGIRGSRPDPALDMLYQAQRDLAAEAEREGSGFNQPPRLALPSH